MQESAYSIYDATYQQDLMYINQHCSLSYPTAIPASLTLEPDDEFASCATDNWHTTTAGETCDSISTANIISSAALFMANQYRLSNCSSNYTLPAGIGLCLPPSCGRTYKLLGTEEECYTIESNATNALSPGDVLRYNPWAGYECSSLLTSSVTYGNVICLGPQNGLHAGAIATNDTTTPITSDGYSYDFLPPPTGATVPVGTTLNCGKWHVAVADETCTSICVLEQIPSDLFLAVNTALGPSGDGCTANLVVGDAYCVGPNEDWSAPYVSVLQATAVGTLTFTYDAMLTSTAVAAVTTS